MHNPSHGPGTSGKPVTTGVAGADNCAPAVVFRVSPQRSTTCVVLPNYIEVTNGHPAVTPVGRVSVCLKYEHVSTRFCTKG